MCCLLPRVSLKVSLWSWYHAHCSLRAVQKTLYIILHLLLLQCHRVTATRYGERAGTGHFHVLIDADEEYPVGTPIPFDSTHLHYGKAQTSASLGLPAGKHKLALQFANALHQSYGPEYSKTINVTVK